MLSAPQRRCPRVAFFVCVSAAVVLLVGKAGMVPSSAVDYHRCKWNDWGCLLGNFQVGPCNITDAQCLGEQAHAVQKHAEAAAASAAKALASIRVGSCNITDAQCLGEQAHAAEMLAQAAAEQKWRTFLGDAESMLGCRVPDLECLRAKSEEAGAQALGEATKRFNEARVSFEKKIGCKLSDEGCLRRRAKELGEAVGNAAGDASDNAAEVAREASQNAARAVVTVLGCDHAITDTEECLLLRARELSAALSIMASTAVLVHLG
jgi:hypothetical protein